MANVATATPPATPGALRRRALSMGLPAAAAAAVGLAADAGGGRGRAHPRGAVQPRGAAPRQRRRGISSRGGNRAGVRVSGGAAASSVTSARGLTTLRSERPWPSSGPSLSGSTPMATASTRPGWNDDTHTSGFFDASLRPHSGTDTIFRARGPSASVGSARATSTPDLSVHSTPRDVRTPRRTAHHSFAQLNRRLQIAGLLDLSALGPPEGGTDYYGTYGSTRSRGGDEHEERDIASQREVLPHCASIREAHPGSVMIPSAPQPTQLEVLHVQRSAATERLTDDIAIVLPDGTPIGAADSTSAIRSASDATGIPAAPTVVLLPGGSRVGAGNSARDSNIKLEVPAAVSDKLLSVKERLSSLLGDAISKPETAFKLPPAPAAAPCQVARGSALLRRHHMAVLSQVDILTDAVLHHVLADTAGLLNSFQSPTVPVQEVAPSAKPEEELPGEVARLAVNELEALEQSLAVQYSGSATAKLGSSDARVERQGLGAQASQPKAHLTPARHSRTTTCWEASPVRLTKGQMAERERKLQPAALPIESVRAVEAYRMRFAQHCLASREAGIVHSDGGDAASVATWTIWPRLADSIALAVVESAVEEVHAAMERHVEELIQQEVGDC